MGKRNFYRLYNINKEGKKILLSWIQRRCKFCKRYLRKHQKVFCDACAQKVKVQQIEDHHLTVRKGLRYYILESVREIVKLPLPTFIQLILRDG